MKETKRQPNPAGRHGKPIVLPPTTFEEAVKKMLNTPAPHTREDGPKKKTASKKR